MGCCNNIVIGSNDEKNINIRIDHENNSLIFTNSDKVDTVIPLSLVSDIDIVGENTNGLRLITRQEIQPKYGDAGGSVLPIKEGVTTLEDNGEKFTYTNEEGQKATVDYSSHTVVGLTFINGASQFSKTLRITFKDGSHIDSNVQIASATRTSELVNDGDGTGDMYVQHRDLSDLKNKIPVVDGFVEDVSYNILTSNPSNSAVGTLTVKKANGATEEFSVMESKTGFDFSGTTIIYHGEDKDNVYSKEQFTDYKRTAALEETCKQLSDRIEALKQGGMTEPIVRAIVENILAEHSLI